MARRNKRRSAAARRASQAPARSAQPQAPTQPGAGRPQQPAAGGTRQQRVEMSLGSQQANRPVRQGRARTARGTVVIPDADPAIPLSQVPHFTSDLVRLVIVAAAMVVLLFIGAQAIPLFVK